MLTLLKVDTNDVRKARIFYFKMKLVYNDLLE